MGFGGSGGGGGSIAGASDVSISSASNGQVLTYDTSIGKWKNAASSGGGGSNANTKGVNVYTSGSYPTRPSGYGSIEWIGPTDPGGSALANDTWVNTV